MRSTVIRQDYRRLNLLMSSRFINIERLVNASPVLGISFMVLSLDSAELGDRVSIALNLAGLVALVASILYLSQFRAGLIDARAEAAGAVEFRARHRHRQRLLGQSRRPC